VWWCVPRAATLFSHFSPREARAEMAVLSQLEQLHWVLLKRKVL
jgi:hypothetical protein